MVMLSEMMATMFMITKVMRVWVVKVSAGDCVEFADDAGKHADSAMVYIHIYMCIYIYVYCSVL